MRCLFVADLHYSLPQFDWLLRSAAGYDLVVLAGDALDVGSIVDYRAQTLVVRKYFQRVAGATRLIVCSGNHDLDSCGAAGEKVARWLADTGALNITRDGNSIVVDDTLFTVCPWWDGPVVRAALVAQLEADARRRQGRRWIWIHHAPPRNSPTSWSGSKSMGGADLEQWIGQHNPDIVVAGHIHQSPFVKDGSWPTGSARHGSLTPAASTGCRPPLSRSKPRSAKRWITALFKRGNQTHALPSASLPTRQNHALGRLRPDVT